MPDPKTTIIVLASSQEAGLEYLKQLPGDDYWVVTTWEKAQGLRGKAIIITPGYLIAVQGAFDHSLRAFWTLEQSVSINGPHRG